MRRAIHCLLILIVCASLFAGCREAFTHASSIEPHSAESVTTPIAEATMPTEETEETKAAPATEEPSAPQETEAATVPPATEEPTIPPEPETTQATEEVWTDRFCSACGVWYEGIELIDGICYHCRNDLCFLCEGPNGPDHNCDDYPNVVCPNPECDWGIYTTGVGIDGIICPKCGTRCV